jgi:hypothetical protein
MVLVKIKTQPCENGRKKVIMEFKKAEIQKLASKITADSELFGDEVATVAAQLTELSNSANEFGCRMTGKIRDCWGGTVTVTAVPDHFRTSWSF